MRNLIVIGWRRRCIDTTYWSPAPQVRILHTCPVSSALGLQDRISFQTECLVFRCPSSGSLPVPVSEKFGLACFRAVVVLVAFLRLKIFSHRRFLPKATQCISHPMPPQLWIFRHRGENHSKYRV